MCEGCLMKRVGAVPWADHLDGEDDEPGGVICPDCGLHHDWQMTRCPIPSYEDIAGRVHDGDA